MPIESPSTEMMVLRVHRAEAIHLYDLRRSDGSPLPDFTAGAHVALRTPNGLIRKFSLCNDPGERHRYLIAIKREGNGRGGSANFVDGVKEGDEVPTSGPVNHFALPPRGQAFLFIAGGIGITPIMSMMRHLQASESKPFRLYYCTRSPEATAFRDELSAPEFIGKVIIHHDQGDPSRSLHLRQVLSERKNREHLYCCGPHPLMEAVREMTAHWSPTAVHFEAFSENDAHKPGDTAFSVKLARSGEVIDVAVDKTMLEALRDKGHVVPSSCETGTCGTCRTRLITGDADHRDLVLGPHERADYVMICISRARSAQLVIDR